MIWIPLYRLQQVGDWYYGKWMKRFYIFYSLLMVAAVITFGPICGVIAAGQQLLSYHADLTFYASLLLYRALSWLTSLKSCDSILWASLSYPPHVQRFGVWPSYCISLLRHLRDALILNVLHVILIVSVLHSGIGSVQDLKVK